MTFQTFIQIIFIEYLKSIEPDKKIVKRFLESIKKVYDDKQKENTAIVRVLKATIQKLEKKTKKIEELVIDGTFSKDQFRRKIACVFKVFDYFKSDELTMVEHCAQ